MQMNLLPIILLFMMMAPAAHAQQFCSSPINKNMCGQLMNRLSKDQLSSAMNCPGACYNFCGGVLQNCDTNYFAGLCSNSNVVSGCVIGDKTLLLDDSNDNRNYNRPYVRTSTTTTPMAVVATTNSIDSNDNFITNRNSFAQTRTTNTVVNTGNSNNFAAPNGSIVRTNGAENMMVNPNPRMQATVTIRNPNGGVQQQTTNRFGNGGGTTTAQAVGGGSSSSTSTTTTRTFNNNSNNGLNTGGATSFFNPQVRVNGVTTRTTGTTTARPGISFPNSVGGGSNTNTAMNSNTNMNTNTNTITTRTNNQGTYFGPPRVVAVNQAATGRTTALGLTRSGSSSRSGKGGSGKRKRASITTVSQRAEATSGSSRHRSKGALATAAAAGLAVLAVV